MYFNFFHFNFRLVRYRFSSRFIWYSIFWRRRYIRRSFSICFLFKIFRKSLLYFEWKLVVCENDVFWRLRLIVFEIDEKNLMKNEIRAFLMMIKLTCLKAKHFLMFEMTFTMSIAAKKKYSNENYWYLLRLILILCFWIL